MIALQNILCSEDGAREQVRIMAAAPVYRSAPVDCAEGDPEFYNTVLEVETDAGCSGQLLAFTQSIETQLGRTAKTRPNAPTRDRPRYPLLWRPRDRRPTSSQIPHPRLFTRRFVLRPLADIRPALIFPGRQKSIAQELADLQSSEPPLVMVTDSANPEKLDQLAALKAAGRQIVAITAYDYPVARLMDEAGVDLILVGDSLGMVVLGHEDTTSVTLEMMVHHTLACRRGIREAVLVSDLPIGSYDTPAQALASARALSAAGADAVKLEGALKQIEKIEAIIGAGIRVIGHIGMLPQRVREEGGYKKKGKSEADLQHLLRGAEALEEAGVDAIIIESTVPAAAERVTAEVQIPVIGIGAGKSCDGQIRVVHDVLGSFPWFVPRFAKTHANLAGRRARGEELHRAVRNKHDA